jgi:hypothetical protein
MKLIKYIFIALILFFSLNMAGYCQMFSFERHPTDDTVTLPAGTLFRGVLENNLSSERNKIGDRVLLLIPFDVKFGKFTIIPKKSYLVGQFIQVQKAQRGRNGLFQVKFEEIRFPDGKGARISAYIWNGNDKGVVGGEITKRMEVKKVPHYYENYMPFAQLIETGERVKGREVKIEAGTECVIVLDNDFEVKYWEKY